MLNKKNVYAIGSPHAAEGYDEDMRGILTVRADLMAHIVEITDATRLFIEGLSVEGAIGLEGILDHYEDNPDQLEKVIENLRPGQNKMLGEGLNMSRLIRLRKKGHQISVAPGEIDRSGHDCMVNFSRGCPTDADFQLMMEFAGAERMEEALRHSSVDGGRMFQTLVEEARIQLGDAEMAKNVTLYGEDKNVLLVGSAHRLDSWEESFDMSRIDIQETESGGVRLTGDLPSDLAVSMSTFQSNDSNMNIKIACSHK